MIVECKHLKRPVDRPIIQKLAQTRDAISAHKAVLATSANFTKEAIAVAEAHCIALWRVYPESIEQRRLMDSICFSLIAPDEGDPIRLFYDLRWEFYSAIGISRPSSSFLNRVVREMFLQITRDEQSHQINALESLYQWEQEAEQKLKARQVPDELIEPLLVAVVGNRGGEFSYIVEHHELPPEQLLRSNLFREITPESSVFKDTFSTTNLYDPEDDVLNLNDNRAE